MGLLRLSKAQVEIVYQEIEKVRAQAAKTGQADVAQYALSPRIALVRPSNVPDKTSFASRTFA